MNSEPFKVREGLGADLANRDLSNLLNTWLRNHGPNPIFRTCASCRNMAQAPNAAFCSLFNATPPVDVILAGCPSYVDNCEIPF